MKKDPKHTLKNKERRLQKKERELDYRATYVTTIIGALTFTAGLFWRDAINGFLSLLPETQGMFGKLISAVVLTGLFVYVIVKMDSKVKEERKTLEEKKKQLDEEKYNLNKQ